MKLLTLFAATVVAACNPTVDDHRTPAPTHWTSVAKATISIGDTAGIGAVTTPIMYTEPAHGVFQLESGTITPTLINDDTLSLGTIDIKKLKINQLNVCGVGGNQKCTIASIWIYTENVPGSGLWNAVDGYGIPLLADGLVVNLDQLNQVTMDSYAIPPNDHRLTKSDLNDTVYDLIVDLSNAGDGDYATDVVVEVMLGI